MQTQRSKLIQEQLALKEKGQRRCYACKTIQAIDNFRITFNNPNSRARCCRQCEREKALVRHHQRMQTRDLDTAARYKIYQAKYRSRDKRKFAITVEDVKLLWNKQNGKCYYTGLPMVVSVNDPKGFSIDRYDSSKGYVRDNIVLCCHVINLMKKDMSEQDFIDYCAAVVRHKQKQ